MASKSEKQRILSSGLNLLPPSDKINDGEALMLDNWRVDQMGELRSRKGSSNIWSGVGSGLFHTLIRAGADRYAGIGNDLLYCPGASNPLSLGSGFFDGNPLGSAFYQGWGWIMNQLRQVKVKGSTLQNWGISPPSAAPVAAAVANNLIGLEGWNSSGSPSSYPGLSAGYLDNGTFNNFPAGVVSFDSTIKQEGISSLKVAANQPAIWVVTDNLYTEFGHAIDSTGGIPANDNDYYSFWFYCTNPAAIASFSVLIFSGNFPGGPAQQVAAIKLDPNAMNLAPNTWTQIQIKRNVNCDSFINQIVSVQNQITAATAAGTDTTDLTAQLNDLQAQFQTALATPHFTETLGTASGEVLATNVDMVAGDPVRPSNVTPFGTALNRGLITQIDWTQISAIQFQIELSQDCTFNLDIATFTTNGTLTGSGQYFVSFANAENEDSDISPASNIINCQNASAQLTGVPTSVDPQVTQRWIWRTGFGSNQVLKVGTISDNVTTVFTDTMAVATAQAINATAPVDRAIPPNALGCMGPYFGKILAWNRSLHPARYYWTNSGEPWHFPGAGNGMTDDESEGNWEDAGNDDDQLIAITNHNQYALMYKQRSLWVLPGDPVNVDAQLIDTSIGLVGPRAVCNAGTEDYFMGPEGVYRRNADFKIKISEAIDPIFKGDSVQLSNGQFLPPIDPTNIVNSVLAIVNDRLYVSYPEQGNTTPNVTLICQLAPAASIVQGPSYRWYRTKLNLGASTTGFTALNYEGAGNSLMAGVSAGGAGQLWALEQGTTFLDGVNPIPVNWQSRFSDQGLPDNFKWYSDIVIDFQTSFAFGPVSTLTVSIIYNNGTVATLGTISSATRTTATFSLNSSNIQIEGGATDEGLRAKNISIQISGNVTSTCIIYNVYLHWYPEERVANTIDSGFTDLGQPERVKQVDYLEIYMTGAGQSVQRILSSDLPGSILAQRDTNTFTAPSGRGNARFRLPNIVEGRNFRSTFTAQSLQFQIHKLRFRQRVIGEYIDGTINEYYLSPEFSVAPGRVGELKDFLLDYDVSGTGGQVIIYADLPGAAGLTAVRTLALPAHTKRQPYVFPLEDANDLLPYGDLFQVKVVPPPGGILRLHGRAIFRARIIGVYFEGQNGEVWETQPLDLLGGTAIYREIIIVSQSTGSMTLQVQTDLPGVNMAPVANIPVDPAATTTGRAPTAARLPGNTKGRLTKFRVSGNFPTRLFELKVLARKLGVNGSGWQWLNVPMPITPDEFQDVAMPVRVTPEEFTWIDLPVDAIE